MTVSNSDLRTMFLYVLVAILLFVVVNNNMKSDRNNENIMREIDKIEEIEEKMDLILLNQTINSLR